MDVRRITAAIAIGLSVAGGIAAQEPTVAWTREVVGVGVVLGTCACEIGGLRQTVARLEVDPREGARLALACPGGFAGTRAIGRAGGGVAAVNGGFFDRRGRGVGVLRIAGEAFGTRHADRTSGVVIDADGRARIATDRSATFDGVRDVMTAGPLLVDDGAVVAHAGRWSKARHPRTAVGRRADGVVVFVTIDGRTPASRGVSLANLAAFMRDLGCVRALNLDGGGSTTMWVRGEPADGIVNHPCDNRRHDHAGERKVPNAIVVLARDVVLGDTEDAALAPASAWRRSTDGDAFVGRDWARATAPDARARWRLPVDFVGEWTVELWSPRAADLGRVRLSSSGLDVRVDQATDAGSWREVGTVRVDAPGVVELELAPAGPGEIAADAVRLVQRG